MSDLRELYQQVIVDHNRSPRNFYEMTEPDRQIEGYNPLCGDQLTLFLKLDETGHIKAISFQGSGCAISVASASLMTEALTGKTVADAETLFHQFHQLITADPQQEAPAVALGKLSVLAGVREFPARIKCATLAWHSLHAALAEPQTGSVSTE